MLHPPSQADVRERLAALIASLAESPRSEVERLCGALLDADARLWLHCDRLRAQVDAERLPVAHPVSAQLHAALCRTMTLEVEMMTRLVSPGAREMAAPRQVPPRHQPAPVGPLLPRYVQTVPLFAEPDA
jgi:hypothetical protein